MDVAAIAACVVWLCNFPNWRIQKRLSRRRFKLQELAEGEALVDDLLRKRLQKPTALQKGVISAFVALGILCSTFVSTQLRERQQPTSDAISVREKSQANLHRVWQPNSALIIVCLASNVANVSETATVLSALTQRELML